MDYEIDLPDGKYEHASYPVDDNYNFYVVLDNVLYEHYDNDGEIHPSDDEYEDYSIEKFRYLGSYEEPEKPRHTPSYKTALECFMDGAGGEFIEQDFHNFVLEQVLTHLEYIQENTDATIKQIKASIF